MIVLALDSAAKTAWWLTLAGGLVVAVVVWALLEALRRTVKSIEAGVEEVLGLGGRLAQNTAAIHSLSQSHARALELGDELERQPSGQGG